MKVCFVHDYLNQFGGAEKTLQAMKEIWPAAPIYTTLVDWDVVDRLGFSRETISYPQWLSRSYFRKFYKYFTFFYPLVFESLDLTAYDVIVSSSANFAKGVKAMPQQVHINYCHTPPRFLYKLPTESNRRRHWFWKGPLLFLDSCLRDWDYTAAQRVDFFIANSEAVKARINKFYRRRARVIYPPVEMKLVTDEISAPPAEGPYLVVSRLSAYKRIELALEACADLGRNIIIVGEGPEKAALIKKSRQLGVEVEFPGFVSEKRLAELYRNCKALIFTSLEEDFGIVPVEAMSCGRPVISLRSGGVEETIIEGETGLFYDEDSVGDLVEAIQRLESNNYFSTLACARKCRWRAERFDKARFKGEISCLVQECYNRSRNA